MIGILLLGQQGLTQGLLDAAGHVLGQLPPQLSARGIDYRQPIDDIDAAIGEAIAAADRGDGVLILADLFGASHTNFACRRLQPGRIELIAGVNLSMLLRVLNYAPQSMRDLVDTARAGGGSGMVHAADRPAARGAAP